MANVGTLCVWDCAGHIEYHVTHGMFLGSENAMGLVVYDITYDGEADIKVMILITVLLYDFFKLIVIQTQR